MWQLKGWWLRHEPVSAPSTWPLGKINGCDFVKLAAKCCATSKIWEACSPQQLFYPHHMFYAVHLMARRMTDWSRSLLMRTLAQTVGFGSSFCIQHHEIHQMKAGNVAGPSQIQFKQQNSISSLELNSLSRTKQLFSGFHHRKLLRFMWWRWWFHSKNEAELLGICIRCLKIDAKAWCTLWDHHHCIQHQQSNASTVVLFVKKLFFPPFASCTFLQRTWQAFAIVGAFFFKKWHIDNAEDDASMDHQLVSWWHDCDWKPTWWPSPPKCHVPLFSSHDKHKNKIELEG